MNSMLQRIKRFLSEEISPYARTKDKKPYFQQYKEMRALWSYYQYPPYQYVKNNIYRRSFKGEVLDYLPPELIARYQRNVNSVSSRVTVDDKIIFNELMTAAGVTIVPIYFVIHRQEGILHLDNSTKIQFDAFVIALSQCNNKYFFIKPYDGGSGEGIFRFELKDGELLIDDQICDESAFFGALFSGRFEKFIVQPAIEQHQILHALCPNSINTVRIDTLVLNHEIVSNGALLRIGNGESYIDNTSKGGWFVAIDLDTGQLASTATNRKQYGGEVIDYHPATRVRFEDIAIPYWDEVLKIIKVGAERLKPLKCLGWDVAIGVDGPIILETNYDFAGDGFQSMVGGLRKTALGQEIVTKFLDSK